MNSRCSRFVLLTLLTLAVESVVLAGGTVSTADEANLRSALAGGGSVTFACSGTITLANTLLITNDTALDASGQSIVLSGSGLTRIFQVQPGVKLWLKNLGVADGLAIGTNGTPEGSGPAGDGGLGQGGAVFNNGGTLTATGCSFSQNTAQGGKGGPSNSLMGGGDGGLGAGGVIYNLGGQLLVTNCSFSQNAAVGGNGGDTILGIDYGGASSGGAIYSTGGMVLAQNCLFSSNRSTSGRGFFHNPNIGIDGLSSGGALEIAEGQLILIACEFSGNSSRTFSGNEGRGGGITQTGGSSQARDCSFESNWAIGGTALDYMLGSAGADGGAGQGGAFCLISGSGGLTNCTFSANEARGGDEPQKRRPGLSYGGAICTFVPLALLNCTIAGNTAEAGDAPSSGIQGGASACGGGIYCSGGPVLLSQVTLANNAAIPGSSSASVALGGNLYSTNGSVSLLNSILNNSLSASNSFGSLTDLGHNVSSDSSCNFTAPGSLNNTDPRLAPLDDYGGPTPTMALLASSPCIDGADSADFAPTDQRGRARPFGSGPDIGAFESSPPYSIHGAVSGFMFKEEVNITIGTSTVASTNDGQYGITGLDTGTWTVTPQSPSYVFAPASLSLTLGPDRVGADFKAYRWNTLSPDNATNGILHIVFAGTNGMSYRWLQAADLVHWSPVATNTIGSNQLWEMSLPITPGTQFYRTAHP